MKLAYEESARTDRPEEPQLLRELLRQCGYTEEGCCARLEVSSPVEFVPIREGRQHASELASGLDVLIRLFLDGDCVADSAVRSMLPPGAPGLLDSLGLTARMDDGAWYGTVSLYPVGQLLIASDRGTMPDRSKYVMPPDCVFPATGQTRLFLECLPPLPCDRLLDLCTGTGIAALQAGYARHSWAVDIAPRSVRFAEFNRLLNGIGRVSVVRGDLYEPVAGMTFDRIVAHPPYVPVNESTYIYRDGGEDGEQITRRIVEGLPAHLAPGGRFYGFCMATDREGEPFEQRIRRWLGPQQGEFDVLLVAWAVVSPDRLTSPLSEDERRHWQRMFDTCHVKHLFHGSFMIERHAASRTAYTVRTQKGTDSGWRESEWLRRWMAACGSGKAAEIVLGSRPKMSERLEVRIVQKVREGRFAVESCTLAAPYPFDNECICEPWIVQAVSGCTGETTGRERFAEGMARRILPPQCTEADFARVLCGMVSAGFLELPEFPLPGPSEPA